MIEQRIEDLRNRLSGVDVLLLVLASPLADKTSITITNCIDMLSHSLILNTCNFEIMELIHLNIESVLNDFNNTPHNDILDELRICLEKAMDILADMPLPYWVEGEATV